MMAAMTQLTASAVAMVDGSAKEVCDALADYQSVRPELLSEDFENYQVDAGGHGAGTRVRWTLAVKHRRRRKRRTAVGGVATGTPWECVVDVDEPAEGTIVERDSDGGRVTTWTVVPGQDGRSAVRVDASWEGPDGLAGALSRSRQRLAVKGVYEDLLTALHDYFEPDDEPEDSTPPA
jgi:hypothetical protein